MFEPPTKRVLGYACEEADRLKHLHIGTEHLLLGLMRDDSIPSAILARFGMPLDEARALVDKLSSAAASPAMLNANALAQIARIEELAVDLENLLLGSSPEVAMRVGLLRMDLEALKSLLDDHQ
jgi:ATP-dependent Clp protease ATP-binding subunit ClpC